MSADVLAFPVDDVLARCEPIGAVLAVDCRSYFGVYPKADRDDYTACISTIEPRPGEFWTRVQWKGLSMRHWIGELHAADAALLFCRELEVMK